MHRFLKALALSTSLLMSTGASFAQTEIVWWDFLTGGDGVRMKSLIKDFNDQNPDIKITSTSLEWGNPFYTKVRTSAAVGQGPDVMTYHISRIPLAMQEGGLSEITPADFQAAGVAESDFFPRAIEAAKSGGKLYAIPFDIHSIVLYYNKKLLEGSPFLTADGKLTGIDSLEGFEKALAYLKEKGVEAPVSYATGDDGGTWRVFYTLFSQMGGTLISGNEVLPGDNLGKAAKAIDIMSRWHQNGWQPEQAEYEASVALFSAGKSGFFLNGVWEIPTYKDLAASNTLGFEWGAVQVPALMGKEGTWGDSHAFAVPNNVGREVSAEKRAAVMKVIGWMEKQSLRWADAGHIPAYKPVADSADYKTMEPNATYAPLANSVVYDPESPIAGVASPVYDAALNIISPAINGYMPGQEAAEMMKTELTPLLR